jgi:hypothetical protein
MALHLAPHMNKLVAPNQSTFIRGRVIHDNFMAVRSSAKLLHTKRLLKYKWITYFFYQLKLLGKLVDTL